MTKQEFEIRAKKPFSNLDYLKIETVYTFHPSISETNGKEQIAYLFNTFGMRIIEDMLPTAKEARELQDEIMTARHNLENLIEKYEKLKSGY